MRTWVAVAIVGWTLLAWGGRIGLLVGGEGLGSWVRIGGSITIGLVAAATLVFHSLDSARPAVLVVFAVFTVALWVRSLVVNWAGSGSLPFNLVHTVLALGFFALAFWAVVVAGEPATSGGDSIATPDEAHGQQQAESETARLTEG